MIYVLTKTQRRLNPSPSITFGHFLADQTDQNLCERHFKVTTFTKEPLQRSTLTKNHGPIGGIDYFVIEVDNHRIDIAVPVIQPV